MADSGLSYFFPSNRYSDVSPYGQSLNDAGMRFTFEEPVYAVGATQIATRYPDIDGPGSLDNNVQNTSYEMIAYDVAGSVIDRVLSSSYGRIVGPVEYHNAYSGTEFMSSYHGILSSTPIHQLTILGARPSSGQLISASGSFSFSFTQINAIPGPSNIAIWSLLCMAGFGCGWRKKRETA
jgi:hypothetical protein